MSPPGALRRPGAAFFRDALDPHTAAMTDGQSSARARPELGLSLSSARARPELAPSSASELMPELAPELAPSST